MQLKKGTKERNMQDDDHEGRDKKPEEKVQHGSRVGGTVRRKRMANLGTRVP